MSILKFSFLKRLITNPQFNSPIKLTPIRKYTQFSPEFDNSLHSRTIQFLSSSPESSITPLLDEFEGKGGIVERDELKRILNTLKSKRLFDRALEVSEWMTSRTMGRPNSSDLAVQLNLTCQVCGIDAAEKFFNKENDHSEDMNVALLSCYVKANLVDKSLSHFKTMKEKVFFTNALAYNNIMTLYMKNEEIEKIPKLFVEMVENGVSPDIESFRICLKSLKVKSDTVNIEKVLSIIDSKRRRLDWLTCLLVADYFIDEGCKEKGEYYLKRAEERIRDPVDIRHLITVYTKLGDKTKVISLWNKHKEVCKAQINIDFVTMITSLVKLDELEEAERIFHEWESSGNTYDFRVVNYLLLGYSRKGLVEKAERILRDITSDGKTPNPDTWTIISEGHIKCRNMEKGLVCMMKALELVLEQKGWTPNAEAISSLLEWLGNDGEIGEVEKFLELLSKVVPMNQKMYKTLIRVNIRHGNEIGDILQRMKDANIDVDEETLSEVWPISLYDA